MFADLVLVYSSAIFSKPGYEPSENDKQAATAIRRLKLLQKGHTGTYITPRERPAMTPKALVARVHQCHVSPIGRREKGIWLLDSGCTIHMTFDRTAFRKLRPLKKPVEILVGNNDFITAEGYGDIQLDTPQGYILLTDVLLVPELSSNLVSYTRLMQRGCTIVSSPCGVSVFEEHGRLLLTAEENRGMLCIHARQRNHRNKRVATEARRKHIGYPSCNEKIGKYSHDRNTMEYALSVQAGVSGKPSNVAHTLGSRKQRIYT